MNKIEILYQISFSVCLVCCFHRIFYLVCPKQGKSKNNIVYVIGKIWKKLGKIGFYYVASSVSAKSLKLLYYQSENKFINFHLLLLLLLICF